jgi:uncharacterized protein YciI
MSPGWRSIATRCWSPARFARQKAAPATGGLWLIEAASAEEARRICTEDPFFTEGLRKSFRLESWSKGFPRRPVTL